MANEPLGIFEELQERRRKYEKLRSEIRRAGPAYNGSYAQRSNPFTRRLLKTGKPFFETDGKPPPGVRRRKTYPEAELGLNIVQVVQAVCLEMNLPVGELLLNGSHKPDPVMHRHVAMWCIDRYCPDFSLPQIGYLFDRDHAAVHYGIELVNRRLSRGDQLVGTIVANIKLRLGGA